MNGKHTLRMAHDVHTLCTSMTDGVHMEALTNSICKQAFKRGLTKESACSDKYVELINNIKHREEVSN